MCAYLPLVRSMSSSPWSSRYGEGDRQALDADISSTLVTVSSRNAQVPPPAFTMALNVLLEVLLLQHKHFDEVAISWAANETVGNHTSSLFMSQLVYDCTSHSLMLSSQAL